MFKFNFGNENNESIDEEKEKKKDQNPISWYECKKFQIELEKMENLKNASEEEIIHLNYEGDITLTCLSTSHIIKSLEKSDNVMSDVLEAEKNHSDLIPGKYEGGLKVWECTKDLVNYIANNLIESLSGSKVLDLGCGAGILGTVALIKGASVTFQDYNHEVIDLITVPNVFMNFKNQDDFMLKSEFFSGDWSSFLNSKLQNELCTNDEPCTKKSKCLDCFDKYDYIFSSETIYNPDNYVKIYEIIKQLMKSDGVCYVAAKRCYFGVGGSTYSFSEYLKKGKLFDVETCWLSNEGVAREILKITFHHSNK